MPLCLTSVKRDLPAFDELQLDDLIGQSSASAFEQTGSDEVGESQTEEVDVDGLDLTDPVTRAGRRSTMNEHAWNLADLRKPWNGVKVMSTIAACGGNSTMGC